MNFRPRSPVPRWCATLGVAWAAGLAPASAEVVVPVEVDVRALLAAGRFDPARDTVGLRGGQPPLSWSHSLPLQPMGDGRWTTTLRFDAVPFGGQPVTYKFRIERPGQGAEAGWESGPNRRLRLDVDAPRIARAFDDPPAPPEPHRSGRIDRLGAVASTHVAAREVQVWLPPGYADAGDRRYPVLYLHDGQNVFDDVAAGAEWQVDETAQRLVSTGAIGPLIVVAVDSGPDRIHDYTPTVDRMRLNRGGGLPAYARFLVDELKPLVDARYRTQPDRAHTAVGGSSLGGLASLWLALHEGATFGAALVVSPSVWWDDCFALRDVQAWPAGLPHTRLWLDMGGAEGDDPGRALAAARRLRDALRAGGWTDATLRYTEAHGAAHDEIAWAARVEGMLRHLDPWPATAPAVAAVR